MDVILITLPDCISIRALIAFTSLADVSLTVGSLSYSTHWWPGTSKPHKYISSHVLSQCTQGAFFKREKSKQYHRNWSTFSLCGLWGESCYSLWFLCHFCLVVSTTTLRPYTYSLDYNTDSHNQYLDNHASFWKVMDIYASLVHMEFFISWQLERFF